MYQSTNLGLLLLRIAAGGMMLTHGFPKLMQFFGAGPIQFADPIGIGVAASLVLAVFAEFLCSILIIIGYKTKFAAIFLAMTMFVAGFVFHAADAFGVKEKAFLYLAIFICLIFTGAGKFSIDRK
jgi:putative oxidoreductase